jgi:hypothetical protein
MFGYLIVYCGILAMNFRQIFYCLDFRIPWHVFWVHFNSFSWFFRNLILYIYISLSLTDVEIHPDIHKQFWDPEHWPKHVLVRYTWSVCWELHVLNIICIGYLVHDVAVVFSGYRYLCFPNSSWWCCNNMKILDWSVECLMSRFLYLPYH